MSWPGTDAAATAAPAEQLQRRVEIVAGADGSRIHCVHAGSGPSVVLAHGYLLDNSYYEVVFRALVEAGHHVIAFDQRGHGRSQAGSAGHGSAAAASDYGAVLDHFAIERGVLVAHSMGGFLALRFCLQQPELAKRRLRRLVLLGANAGGMAARSLENRLQVPMIKSGLLSVLWRTPGIGPAMVAGLFGSAPDPRCVELTRAMLLRQDVQRSLPLLHAMRDESYHDRLGEISIQVRVLCGELDRTCPPSHSRRIGQALPNASNHWLPGKGHMLAYEAPDAVVEAVRGG